MVRQFKDDPRGPYASIRWFCPDGTVLPASARCSSPGGIQQRFPKRRSSAWPKMRESIGAEYLPAHR